MASWFSIALTAAALTACASTRSSLPPDTPPPPAPREARVQQQVVRGAELYVSYGCAACHSTDGRRGAGPTFAGLAGHRVPLRDGRTVTATDAYLRRAITHPDAQVVRGYPPALMARAVARRHLDRRPGDVAALVQFLNSIAPERTP